MMTASMLLDKFKALGTTIYFSPKLRKFLKKHSILLGAVLFLVLYTLIVTSIARHNAIQETTEELSIKYQAEYDSKLQAYIDEQTQLALESAEAKQKTEMERKATCMAKAAYGVRKIASGISDIRTYYWSMFCREHNSTFPNDIEQVVSQPNQYMGYSENNPVLEEYYQAALEELETFYNGRWPITDDYVYCGWDSNGHFELRNEFIEGKSTRTWYYGK